MSYTLTEIGWDFYKNDFIKLAKELQKIANKYKDKQTKNSCSPSAPDTSKFIASHSGKISCGIMFYSSCMSKNEVLYLNVGFNVENEIHKTIENEINEILKKVNKNSKIKFSVVHSFGSNYSPHRIYAKLNDKSVELKKSQYFELKKVMELI